MRLRLNDQAVLYIEFMVEQHPEKHSSFLPFLCQRYAITGALQLSTTFLQLLKREGRHKRTRDEWKKFHEPRIVQALKPYRAAWSRMKGAEFCSRQWRAWINKPSVYAGLRHLSTSKDALKDAFWHSHLHQYERVHNLKRKRFNQIWTTKRTFSKEI